MGNLVSGAVALLVVTIVIAVSATLLGDFKKNQSAEGQAGNLTADFNTTIDNGITSVKTFSQNLNTLALVIIFGIIIGVVLLYFGGLAGGGRRGE